MLGRKAEWQTSARGNTSKAGLAAKRKWQLEQDKSEDEDDEDFSLDSVVAEAAAVEAELDQAAKEAQEAKAKQEADPQAKEPAQLELLEPCLEPLPRKPRRADVGAIADSADADADVNTTRCAQASIGDSSAPRQEEKKDKIGSAKEKEAIEAEDEEDEEDEDGGEGTKRQRFAWMDSDEENAEDEEEAPEEKALVSGSRRIVAVTVAGAGIDAIPMPPAPPVQAGLVAAALRGLQTPMVSGGRPGFFRPNLRPPLVLPPDTRLPNLTQPHLALMAQIGMVRTVDTLWDLIDKHSEQFAAAHAATSLYRLSLLSATANGVSLADQRPEKQGAFVKLSDRIDELLSTAAGRASFLPGDLAMVVSALAKVIQVPISQGAITRIFADIADEAEMRIVAEPSAFTPPMLGDLAWGISRGCTTAPGIGGIKPAPPFDTRRFFSAVVQAATSRVIEMTCQDLANFAAAYAENTGDGTANLLRGVFEQTKLRLAYKPPATNALFGTQPVALTSAPFSLIRPVGATLVQPAAAPAPIAGSAGSDAVASAATTGAAGAPAVPAESAVPATGAVPGAAEESAALAGGAVLEEAGGGATHTAATNSTSEPKPEEPEKSEMSEHVKKAEKTDRPPQWQQMGQWKFTGAQISDIAASVARHINLYEPHLFDLVAHHFLQRLQEFNLDQLKKMNQAFDIVRHDRDFDFLKAMKASLKQREMRRRCHSYRQGVCKFGDRCTFSHED